MFCIGNFSFLFGGSFGISTIYGRNSQIIWCFMTSGFCGVFFLILNATVFMPIGHISHGWYKNDKENFLKIIYLKLSKIINTNSEK